jgi:hypothetical protein
VGEILRPRAILPVLAEGDSNFAGALLGHARTVSEDVGRATGRRPGP